MTVTVEVYEPDGATLVDTIDPGQFTAPTHTEALNLQSSGSLQLPRWVQGVANPALALVAPGRIVRFEVDGTVVGQFVVERPAETVVSRRSEVGETLAIAGREPIAALFDKCYWDPDRGMGRLPFHPSRPLSFAADRLRDDDPAGPNGAWPPAVGQTPDQDNANYFGRGIGFVDTVGPDGLGPEWLADRDSRIAFAPGGIQYYRQRVTLDDDYDVLLQAVFDDEGELWVDNTPQLKALGVYKGGCVETRLRMSQGESLVAGYVRNLNELRVGVAFAGWSLVNDQPDELLFRSDASSAIVLAYPADPPGFTPTEVIRLGWDEGQDRSMLLDVALDFTSAAGSPIGGPNLTMNEVTDIVVKAPAESLFTTCRVLVATYLDLIAQRDSLTLEAYRRGTYGDDRTATVQFGPGNCAQLILDSDYHQQATVAKVTVQDAAPFEVIHPDEADLGRIEVPLDFGETSVTTARVWARRYLDEISNARKGISLELVPGLGPAPYDDFFVGDTVATVTGVATMWGPDPVTWGDDPAEWTDAHRVTAIRFDPPGPDGIVRWKVDLDQPGAVLEERLASILRRQLPSSNGGRTILAAETQPPSFNQVAGFEHTETWSTPATGEVVLRKNGTPIPGASLTVAAGATDTRTLLAPARQYVPKVDKIDFTVAGVAGFPAGWAPPEGSWLLEFGVTAETTGLTITVKYR